MPYISPAITTTSGQTSGQNRYQNSPFSLARQMACPQQQEGTVGPEMEGIEKYHTCSSALLNSLNSTLDSIRSAIVCPIIAGADITQSSTMMNKSIFGSSDGHLFPPPPCSSPIFQEKEKKCAVEAPVQAHYTIFFLWKESMRWDR